jgi:hypothetical protein
MNLMKSENLTICIPDTPGLKGEPRNVVNGL